MWLSLLKMEYCLPKLAAQIRPCCNDLKGPLPLKSLGSVIKPQDECSSKLQLHFFAMHGQAPDYTPV